MLINNKTIINIHKKNKYYKHYFSQEKDLLLINIQKQAYNQRNILTNQRWFQI